MKSKATEIKELLGVFKPKPIDDKNENFYVDTNNARGTYCINNIIDHLEVNSDEYQKILFMGHYGSGKSTELWQLKKKLNKRYSVVDFSIREEADPVNFKYIDMFFIILDKLLAKISEEEIEIEPTVINDLDSYWNTDRMKEIVKYEKADIEAGASAKLGFLTSISAHVKGIIATGKETKETIRTKIEPNLKELIDNLNKLILEANQKLNRKNQKKFIIIIDDLEKLEIPDAKELFYHHSQTLNLLNIDIIYTFPIFLRYSKEFNQISQNFDCEELFSMIKVREKDDSENIEGINLINDIIERRADPNLFEDGAIDYIILKSGGDLRTTFEIIENSVKIVRGINRDSKKVTLDAVKKSFKQKKSDFQRQLRKEYLPVLKEIYNDKNKKPYNDKEDILLELLHNKAVIEYNGERWIDVNPAVKELLDELV